MTQQAEPKIVFRNVDKKFGDGPAAFEALKDFNLEIADGEIVTVVGPSGCGKSTVMNIAAGLGRRLINF